jgi:hypothetical protein
MTLFRRSEPKPFELKRRPVFATGTRSEDDVERPETVGAREQVRADARVAEIEARREKVLARERERAEQRGFVQGRREEQARHRGHPFLTLILALGAAACAFVVYLAVQQGSFTGAGQVLDQHVTTAAQATTAATQTAESHAGDALENAGARLKKND